MIYFPYIRNEMKNKSRKKLVLKLMTNKSKVHHGVDVFKINIFQVSLSLSQSHLIYKVQGPVNIVRLSGL